MVVRFKFAVGSVGRVVVVRLQPGTDIIEGVEKVCDDLGIDYAYVDVGTGTLAKATLMYFIPNPNVKIGASYSPPKEIVGPLSFLGGSGVIGRDEKGNRLTHIHGAVCDQWGHVHGGHLVKGGNPILVTSDVIIMELKGVKIVRKYDAEIDFSPLEPEQA
ncbi:MAG: DNA-binding protein [Sulfolobales archaeon]